jgi:hypothetical protein
MSFALSALGVLTVIAVIIILFRRNRLLQTLRAAHQEQETERQFQVEAKAERSRRIDIWAMRDQWSEAVCLLLDSRQVTPGMTAEMVKASLGEPSGIDQQQITGTGGKTERWIYGKAFQYAKYIHFTDSRVSKVTGQTS